MPRKERNKKLIAFEEITKKIRYNDNYHFVYEITQP